MRKKRPQDCFGRWSAEDDERVRELYRQPGGPREIEEETGRTLKAVHYRAYRLGLTEGGKKLRGGRKFQDPPPARMDLLESMKCPGNGKGCGHLLWKEMVPSGYGYIAPGKFDLVCVAGHRFRL